MTLQNLSIYIIPTVSLVLVMVLYAHFYRKVSNKPNYKRLILTIAIVGFVLNLIWELAQGPLYKDYQYDWDHISFCILASLTDMLTLLVLFFAFGLVFKNVYWIKQLSFFKVLMLMFVGGFSVTILEIWHINRGDWLYAESMPIIPVVHAGVSPVLQFTVLPLIIFLISEKLQKLNTENFKYYTYK